MGRFLGTPATQTMLRAAIVLCTLVTIAPAALVVSLAAGLSLGLSVLVTSVAGVLSAAWIRKCIPMESQDSRRHRVLLLAFFALTFVASCRIASLSAFMFDVTSHEHAFDPATRALDEPAMAKPFYPTHNCFTCYIVAGHLATQRVENLYDSKYYRRATVKTPIHHQIGKSLHVDSYQYPPPFLVLPRLLQATGGDFHQLRSYWFGVNLVLFPLTMLALIVWIGGAKFSAMWLAIPAMLASPIVIGTLQIENVHLFMITVAMLALWGFARGWNGFGGALLAFAIVSKIYPGMLLVFLLLQRRWRSAIWTCVWGVAYCAITLGLFGSAPFEAFLNYQLPRLASGEAFSFAIDYIAPLVKNTSILGVAYKLEKLGLISEPASLARILVWGHTVVFVGLVAWFGLREYDWSSQTNVDNNSPAPRLKLARVWLVILILGQLRSPFLPWVYGNIAALWLLALLVPIHASSGAKALKFFLIVVSWVVLSTTPPLPFGPPTVALDLIFTLSALAIVLLCCVIVAVQWDKDPLNASKIVGETRP